MYNLQIITVLKNSEIKSDAFSFSSLSCPSLHLAHSPTFPLFQFLFFFKRFLSASAILPSLGLLSSQWTLRGTGFDQSLPPMTCIVMFLQSVA